VLEDSSTVEFASGQRRGRVRRGLPLPGPHAVFVGASFLLGAYPASKTLGPLQGPVAVASVEPPGVAEAAFVDDPSWGRILKVRALRAGAATIRLTASGAERLLAVRVADESDAVSVAVHRPALSPTMMGGGVGADTDVVGEPARPRWMSSRRASSRSGRCATAPPRRRRQQGPVGALGRQVYVRASAGAGHRVLRRRRECRSGDVRVTAEVGGATLDVTYEQRCKSF
jgi:hypothetical protein